MEHQQEPVSPRLRHPNTVPQRSQRVWRVALAGSQVLVGSFIWRGSVAVLARTPSQCRLQQPASRRVMCPGRDVEMRTITLDEYYLTEQDEPTVQHRTGRRANCLEHGRRTVEASLDGGRRPAGRGLHRRMHILRRAAVVALAA